MATEGLLCHLPVGAGSVSMRVSFGPDQRTKRRSIGEVIHQFLCGLRNHRFIYKYKANREYLVCAACGCETPGWDVTPKRLVFTRSQKQQA